MQLNKEINKFNHSLYGCQLGLKLYREEYQGQLLAFDVTIHHSTVAADILNLSRQARSLQDVPNPGRDASTERTSNPEQMAGGNRI